MRTLDDFNPTEATEEELKKRLELVGIWKSQVHSEKGDKHELYKALHENSLMIRDVLDDLFPRDWEEGFGESQFFGQEVSSEDEDDEDEN